MDTTTNLLDTYLVKMAYEGATHQQEHQMEHLLALLDPADEQALVSYYGLFDEPRLSLEEIARKRSERQEQTMQAIDNAMRSIALSLEWQQMEASLTQQNSNESRESQDY